jgi:hypothetical protein
MQGIYLNVSLYIYFRSLYIYIYIYTCMHHSLFLHTSIYIYNIYLLPTCCGVRPSTAGFGSNNNCVRSHPPMEQQRRSRSRSVGRKPPPAAPPPARRRRHRCTGNEQCLKRCREGPPGCACGTHAPRARCIFVAGHRRVPNHMCGTCFDWLHSAADGAYGPYMAPDYLAGNLYEGAK